VRPASLNVHQRIIVLIGLGAGFYVFGSWLTTRGEGGSGWVAYAPLSRAIDAADLPGPGLHPWVRLLIWLALIAVWVLVGVALLRPPSTEDPPVPVD
jgi:hypothetical protein